MHTSNTLRDATIIKHPLGSSSFALSVCERYITHYQYQVTTYSVNMGNNADIPGILELSIMVCLVHSPARQAHELPASPLARNAAARASDGRAAT